MEFNTFKNDAQPPATLKSGRTSNPVPDSIKTNSNKMSRSDSYFIKKDNGDIDGPFSYSDLESQHEEGHLSVRNLIRKVNSEKWIQFAQLQALKIVSNKEKIRKNIGFKTLSLTNATGEFASLIFYISGYIIVISGIVMCIVFADDNMTKAGIAFLLVCLIASSFYFFFGFVITKLAECTKLLCKIASKD